MTWKPTPKTVVFWSKEAGALAPKTMKGIIEEEKVERIYQHQSFSAGVAPPAFKILKTMHSLIPEDWQGATSAPSTKLQWL